MAVHVLKPGGQLLGFWLWRFLWIWTHCSGFQWLDLGASEWDVACCTPSLRVYGNKFSAWPFLDVLTESTWLVATGLWTLNPYAWKLIVYQMTMASDSGKWLPKEEISSPKPKPNNKKHLLPLPWGHPQVLEHVNPTVVFCLRYVIILSLEWLQFSGKLCGWLNWAAADFSRLGSKMVNERCWNLLEGKYQNENLLLCCSGLPWSFGQHFR